MVGVFRFVFIIALLLCLAACGTYYRVKDVQSDKTYYTTDIDESDNGAVIFTDENTGSRVTLQNSEVKEVNKEEFTANTEKK